MLLIALLMVSTIRYPSGKKVDLQTQTRLRTFVVIIVVGGFDLLAARKSRLSCLFLGLHLLRICSATGRRVQLITRLRPPAETSL